MTPPRQKPEEIAATIWDGVVKDWPNSSCALGAFIQSSVVEALETAQAQAEELADALKRHTGYGSAWHMPDRCLQCIALAKYRESQK